MLLAEPLQRESSVISQSKNSFKGGGGGGGKGQQGGGSVVGDKSGSGSSRSGL